MCYKTEDLLPEQNLQGALVFVQRPSQRVPAKLVQLLHGADIFPLLLARLVCGSDEFRQRF